jgi:hypothetical protein
VREGKSTEEAAAEDGHPPFSFTSSPPTHVDHDDGTAQEEGVDDRDRLLCFNLAVLILDRNCTEVRKGRSYVCAEARQVSSAAPLGEEVVTDHRQICPSQIPLVSISVSIYSTWNPLIPSSKPDSNGRGVLFPGLERMGGLLSPEGVVAQRREPGM